MLSSASTNYIMDKENYADFPQVFDKSIIFWQDFSHLILLFLPRVLLWEKQVWPWILPAMWLLMCGNFAPEDCRNAKMILHAPIMPLEYSPKHLFLLMIRRDSISCNCVQKREDCNPNMDSASLFWTI